MFRADWLGNPVVELSFTDPPVVKEDFAGKLEPLRKPMTEPRPRTQRAFANAELKRSEIKFVPFDASFVDDPPT